MKTLNKSEKKAFYAVTEDSTKSVCERQMAGLLARGYEREEAIKQHQQDCDIDKDESSYYYDAVLESIEE